MSKAIISVLLSLAAMTVVTINAQSVSLMNSIEVQTCCVIESACLGCPNVYKVNSLVYCCLNCQGEVLVTALICTCTLTVADPSLAPNCTVSNKVVGDYIYERPSYYYATGTQTPALSVTLLLAICCLTILAQRYCRL
jgi:hypothetical protein